MGAVMPSRPGAVSLADLMAVLSSSMEKGLARPVGSGGASGGARGGSALHDLGARGMLGCGTMVGAVSGVKRWRKSSNHSPGEGLGGGGALLDM